MFGTNLRRLAALTLLPVALVACDDETITGPQFPEDVEFAAALGVDLSQMTQLASGVYIQTLEDGTGDRVADGQVRLAYTLWLPDGTEVDSSTDFTTVLGAGALIPGFEEGVSGMRVGETRLIVVPSELGYGSQGTSRIPPNSVLVFRVELLEGGGPA